MDYDAAADMPRADIVVLHILPQESLAGVLLKAKNSGIREVLALQHNRLSPNFIFYKDKDGKLLTRGRLAALLSNSGFEEKQTYHAVLLPLFLERVFSRETAKKLDLFLSKTFLRHFSRNILIKARLR
jgi:hypothetical protein